jgi:4-aminobutyrate aminotransferase/(S)-3-amino-2-methylpropionate transaminase
VTFERWTRGRSRGQTVLGNSGFEAVEIALKTALLKTHRAGIIAFEGGYHGLGYGALLATWRPDFRRPFARQLRPVTSYLPFPTPDRGMREVEKRLPRLLHSRKFGAVVVEPIQGRAGVVFPPDEFLPFLRHWCDKTGTLLVADEIFTGFWRTGKMFAVEHSGVIPDLICLGKALTGALPLSACVGRSAVMRAWPKSRGEALHTSTFLGNPLACAAALASIRMFDNLAWEKRLDKAGASLWELLVRAFVDRPHRAVRWLRGSGMAFGIEMAPGTAVRVCQRLLARGIIALAEGNRSETLAILPPLTATAVEMRFAIGEIRGALDELA